MGASFSRHLRDALIVVCRITFRFQAHKISRISPFGIQKQPRSDAYLFGAACCTVFEQPGLCKRSFARRCENLCGRPQHGERSTFTRRHEKFWVRNRCDIHLSRPSRWTQTWSYAAPKSYVAGPIQRHMVLTRSTGCLQ